MRKLLYSLAAVATLLFAASCAQEKLGGPIGGETVEATFSVALPDAVVTKAISDGANATKIMFRAFDADGKHIAGLDKDDIAVSGYKATHTARLIKGLTYSFVFWAYQGDTAPTITYDADSKNPTIKWTPADMMNDDTFDAFYARIEGKKVESAFAADITLTRPFAQVNVGAYADDFAAAESNGIDVTPANMLTSYKVKVPTTLNLIDGTIDEPAEVPFSAKARPAEDLTVGSDSYKWVAMAYVLRPCPNAFIEQTDGSFKLEENAEAKETVQVDFHISTKQNTSTAVELDRTVYNVPVQRNYRTNILGYIFSVEGSFNILVDQNFQPIGASDLLPEYADIDALNKAFANTAATDADKWSYKVKVLTAGSVKTITLPDTSDPVDIVFADGAFANEDITVEYASATAAKPVKLTVKVDEMNSLTANLPQTTINVVTGSLIHTATITSAPGTFVIEQNAKVENLIILGGGVKIEGTVGDADITTGGATVTFATTAEITGTVNVNDGAVVIEDGATVNENEGGELNVSINATVDDNSTTPVDMERFGEIASQAALETALAGGGEFTVAADIVINKSMVVPTGKTVVLDMNGKTLSNTEDIWKGSDWSMISVRGGNLTIKGNGTLQAKENDEYAVDVQCGGSLTIVDGTFVGNITSVYIEDEGSVEILGGTFSILQLSDEPTDKYRFTLNCLDASYKSGKDVFTVKGGTYKEFDPANNQAEGPGTNFLADGYRTTSSVDNDGNTWYTVEEGTPLVAHDAFAVPETATVYTSGANQSYTIVPVTASDYTGTVAFEITEGSDIITLEGAQVSHKAQSTGTAKVKVSAPADEKYVAAEATVTITVKENKIESISWKTEPTAEEKAFVAGDNFIRGGEVLETLTDGDSAEASFYGIKYYINDVEVTDATILSEGDFTVVVKDVDDNVASTCNTLSYEIVVSAAPYQYAGAGTAEDPYTVADVRHFIDALSDKTTGSADPVFIKGKVVSFANKGKYSESGTYGNASFFITETGDSTEDQFEVFRALYFGGEKWATGQPEVAVGDEIVVQGKVKYYETSSVYETAGGDDCYVISINGKTGVAAKPTITSEGTVIPADGTLAVTLEVTDGSAIWYQIDDADAVEYTAALSLENACTVTAYAKKDGLFDSPVATKTFTKSTGSQQSWKLVTDASVLKDGDVVILGAYNATYTANKVNYTDNKVIGAVNTTLSSPIAAAVDVSFDEDGLGFDSLPNGAIVITLHKNGSKWNLETDGQYLCYSKKNTINLQESAFDWTLSISSNSDVEISDDTVITSGNDAGTYKIQYNPNSGNGRFAAYKSAQKAIRLYRYE